MLKIAICDDNLPITSEIESLLLDIQKKQQLQMDLDIYFDGVPLYNHILAGNNYDLIYLDIEMTELDGIKTAHLIRSLNLPTLLIYVSAYETYYKQLFEVEPFRFLLKPIDSTLFYKYFKAAYSKICNINAFFSFSFNQRYTKILVTEIIFFESRGRDILIYTSSQTYRFIGKLNTVEQDLKNLNLNFLRIHQSYLINPQHIHSLTLSIVELSNNTQLHVSPKFQKKVRSQYLSLFEDY